MKTLALVLAIGAGWPGCLSAQSAPLRTPVTDPRPLLVAALASPTGVAHGVLSGDSADLFARQFRSTAPVFIDVTTERRLPQAGCSRLHLVFWQEAVMLPGATAPRRETIAFGINYCRNGQPPRPAATRPPA